MVSAPSGGGKGTILAAAFKRDDRLRYAVSATTRAARPGEVDGRQYTFLSADEFKRWIADDRFAEWAEVHGEYYGTPASELDAILKSGCDPVLELDVQGMRTITQHLDDVISIFIVPPSLEILEQRLRDRGDLTEAQLALRLKNAEEEMAASKEYDYVILNDDLNEAIDAFVAIVADPHPSEG